MDIVYFPSHPDGGYNVRTANPDDELDIQYLTENPACNQFNDGYNIHL